MSFDIIGAIAPLQEGIMGGGFLIILLLVFLVVLAGFWKVFTKAGEAGWKSLIPIYNVWVLSKISGSGALWFVLSIILGIPFVKITIDLSKSFGKGTGFGIGLWLLAPIFFPILGFGDAQYQGPHGS